VILNCDTTVNTPLESIVAGIQDSHQARIKLSLTGGEEQHFDCIFKEDEPPCFLLVFQLETLPDNVDMNGAHPVSILQDSNIPSLNSTVVAVVDERTLRMQATGTVDPASLREYFRVNATTQITASYKAETGSLPDSGGGWTINGNTQDLSASGVLALFDKEPKNRDNVIVEIFLPNNNLTVTAVAHVVRKKMLRNRRWQVSFHFSNISTKHRDAIVTYLLGEQRKQLRENIRTRDL